MRADALKLNPGANVLIAVEKTAESDRLVHILTENGHSTTVTSDGESALRKLRSQDVETVILSDGLLRPNAFQVCERIKNHPTTSSIAVLILLSERNDEQRERGLEMGADDFLYRPVDAIDVPLRVRSLARIKRLADQGRAAEGVIFGLAELLKSKVGQVTSEAPRLAEVASHLGAACGLPEQDLETLRRGAYLHDVGKLGIRENVLLKPEQLSTEEFAEIQTHPELGERICLALDGAEDLLPVIRHQQERWDGKGYPDGLAGEAIPLLARIMSIAQAYDAMLSPRPYRPALTVREARSNLLKGAGAQWDPRLVELFLLNEPAPSAGA